MQLPTIGTSAPAFSLLNQADEMISLEDFRDQKNVLLYFYPKAMTPGCTVQACGIRDSKEAFAELDTVVLAVSPDAPVRLGKFQDKESLNFTLLSDQDHTVTESYGAWGLKKFMGREYMGVFRYTFVIDKRGHVVKIMDKVKTKTHHEDSLQWIKDHL
ncbi:MAG: thioredoxin-dependent thiol peroxidase [Porticoccaceae bacterium]|nr:thioredoxin-dependent thiol peroxidase [Porticoccaceae bacterium]